MATKKIVVKARIKPKNQPAKKNPVDDIDYFVNMMHEEKRLAHQRMMEDPMLFASMVNENAERKRRSRDWSDNASYIHSGPVTLNIGGRSVTGYAERLTILDGNIVETLTHTKEVRHHGR